MMNPLRITVCELDNDTHPFEDQWNDLMNHVQEKRSDILLLPEMIFAPWFSDTRPFNPRIWDAAIQQNNHWIHKLEALQSVIILGSCPAEKDGKRINQGFVYSDTSYQLVHTKYYLPDEKGFWEASWYQRDACSFIPHQIGNAKIGFTICTDMWFYQHARNYGQQGVDILAVPRATPHESLDKWFAGGRAAAVVSGAFCISSNRFCPEGEGPNLGGLSWIISPEGKVLAETSQKNPFITMEIDLEQSKSAKKTYPRYVKE